MHCPSLAAATQSNTNAEGSTGARAGLTAAGDAGKSDEACVRCHEKVVRGFVSNPHASIGQAPHGPSRVTCTSCHGSGEAHIESGGDKSKIFNPTEAAAGQVNDICLKCHAGGHAIFERSAHGRSGVNCVRCHSIHAAHEPKHLLRIAQPELCFQCHEDQRSQFFQTFRHKVTEGVILCTDCHEPHGSFGEQLQRFPTQQDIICTKCHTEMAGPYKFEHDIVKAEGCIACHFPHGGPNGHMLNRAMVNTICLLCHFPQQISSTGESLLHAHDTTAKGPLCTDCHAEIHGSNVSSTFLKNKSAM
jgi:DmsE family decaheme c-type cytochrome